MSALETSSALAATEPQAKYWMIPRAVITSLQGFLTTSGYRFDAGDSNGYRGITGFHGGSECRVGSLLCNKGLIEIQYAMDVNSLREQIAFRELLDENKIPYREIIPRGKAAEDIVAYAKELVNLAHIVDEHVHTPCSATARD